MSNDKRIDFKSELEEIIPYTEFLACETQLVAWAKSIAERVEEQTIERCADEIYKNEFPEEILATSRLYAQRASGEKGESNG